MSVPNMLTADNYDNTVPYLEFVKTSFLGQLAAEDPQGVRLPRRPAPMLKYTVYTDFSGVPLGGEEG